MTTMSSKSSAWTARAVVLFCLAGCGEERDASRPVRRRPSEPSSSPALNRSAARLPSGEEGPRAEDPGALREQEIAIRGGRARVRAEVSSGRPVVLLAGERYSLVRADGTFDRESAESLFSALEATGPFLEIELTLPAEVPGKLVEQLVFFMEEKGKVPIVSSPGVATDSR